MTIKTKLTGDSFTFAKVNSESALNKFTDYMNRGMFTVEDAQIIEIPESETPARYLQLSVKAFPGPDVEGREWYKENFTVTIDLEPEKEAD